MLIRGAALPPCAALPLQKLLQHAPLAVDKPKFTDPHTKVNALVQVRCWAAGRTVQVGRNSRSFAVQARAAATAAAAPASPVPRPPACQAAEAWKHSPSTSPQTHLSRGGLNPDMAADAQRVVGQATRLLQSMVDVISSSGWLNPALAGALLLGRGCRGVAELRCPGLQLPLLPRPVCSLCRGLCCMPACLTISAVLLPLDPPQRWR